MTQHQLSWLKKLALTLKQAPPDAELAYTINDDGVWVGMNNKYYCNLGWNCREASQRLFDKLATEE